MASGNGIKAELLDELLKGQDAKTLFEQDGLLDELKKALAERALNGVADARPCETNQTQEKETAQNFEPAWHPRIRERWCLCEPTRPDAMLRRQSKSGTYNCSRRYLMLINKTWQRNKLLQVCSTLAMLGVLAATSALAQKFPWKPIRLVVPYPPGGANDTVVRLLAPGLTELLGQQIVIDNRGGGNTIIGSELVARSVPDGHTVLMIAAGHAINPSLYPKLPYDTARDFVPVVLIGDGAYVLVAHPALGAATVPELIALAKAKPGQITYASSSIGNLTHLAAELFSSLAGVKMLHVPYKGGGPAMLDLLGGRISVFFSTVAVARPRLLSGRIKGLGVTTPRRTVALPDVPTIAEAGLPGYAASGW